MSGGVAEIHRDNDYLATGTHKGSDNAAALSDPGADFKSCGVVVGSLIRNTTDGSEGAITSVTEDEIGVTLAGGTDDDWDNGDVYEIYKTDTYNKRISSIWCDRSRGWRSDKEKLDRGWRLSDVDLDRDTPDVFGPGQPERN
jgi:hypothetical protein